jgi:hypothetical protein
MALPPETSPRRNYNFSMENAAAELLRKALHLPEAARAAHADSLWESLDHEVDEGAEDASSYEVHRASGSRPEARYSQPSAARCSLYLSTRSI